MPRPDQSAQTARRLAEVMGSRPFTRRQAVAAGISRARLESAISRGTVERHGSGVFTVSGQPSDDEQMVRRIEIALLTHPGSVASYTSAAVIHELPNPAPGYGAVHLVRPGSRYRLENGVHVHGSPLPPNHATVVDGLGVTTPERTAVDIARRFNPPRALMVVDAVLRLSIAQEIGDGVDLRAAVHDEHRRWRAQARLVTMLKDLRGWQGIRRARRSVMLGDPAAESPLESFSRGTWSQMGIPLPECGVPILGADGATYWADQMWRRQRVIGECDGLGKYTDAEVLRREKLRQEAIEQQGWIIVRWTWDDVSRRPQDVVRRWRAAVDRANRSDLPRSCA